MQRTDQQRKAIEVYCREVAEVLNEKGYTLKDVLEKKPLDVSCTQENIKANIFRPLGKALFDKKSTTQLSTGEVVRVYDEFNKWLGENFEVHIPWPSEDI